MALWYQDLRGVIMAEKKAKDNPKNAGRKDYYKERIEPRLAEIKEWYSIGVSEEQVYKNLGVGRTTFYKYKKSKPELQEAIRSGITSLQTLTRLIFLISLKKERKSAVTLPASVNIFHRNSSAMITAVC